MLRPTVETATQKRRNNLGYTHYWTLKGCAPAEEWSAACKDIRKLLKAQPGLVRFESEDPSPPLIDALEIRFNGVGNKGHETFTVCSSGQTGSHMPGWAFCKTARKDYDLLVTACLLVLKAHMPLWIKLESDGRWERRYEGAYADGWGPAAHLCAGVLGYVDNDFVLAKQDLART